MDLKQESNNSFMKRYQCSKISYDGELIDLDDGLARYERDERIQEKYAEAENSLDVEQSTWSYWENFLD